MSGGRPGSDVHTAPAAVPPSGLTVAAQREAAAELLRGMFADIDASHRAAEDVLRHSRDPMTQSFARQVVGITHRERGDLPRAVRDLRTAMRLADRADSRVRRADAQATLGATLAFAGRTTEGLAHLDEAIGVLRGADRAAALTRRGWIYVALQGRYADGAADLSVAVRRFAAEGDKVWHARALNFLGYARLGMGDLAAADTHFEQSGGLSLELGHEVDHAYTVQNRGYVAYLQGDLPRTYALLSTAADAFQHARWPNADLVVDQCTAYLAGGLLTEATDTIDAALRAGRWAAREKAELLHTRAQVALAAGDLTTAQATAGRAMRIFTAQGRDWFAARSNLVRLTARHAAARRPSPALARDVLALVEEARQRRLAELPQALLLAADVVQRSDPAHADSLLAEAQRAVRDSAALHRALGWLAAARRRAAAGDTAAMFRACDRGLAAIDEHQALLGSAELRALASAHGRDLAALALEGAVRARRPRQMLHWAERWRATSATAPRATGHRDPDTERDLATLRAHTRRAATARDAGHPDESLERSITRLERTIRERHLQRAGTTADRERSVVGDLVDELTRRNTVLVGLFTVGAELHAAVAGRGRVRHVHVGPLDRALQAQEFAAFVLRRAGRGHPTGLDQAGARLQEAVLGPAARLLGPGAGSASAAVVVSPPSQLQRVPWGLVPALADRPVSATPAARLWLRAARRRPAGGDRVFIVGPGLASGGAEVDVIRRHDPGATYLHGSAATVPAALASVAGADLVHIAAHGTFRRDNPLFSALDLSDGPLMVHDLEQLAHPPHTVILSGCETGDMRPVGVDELLGLSVTLLSLGSTTVVSSLVKVHDQATVEVMTALHAALRRGEAGAEAMRAARDAVAGDALLAATAASFVSFGA